MAEQKGDPYPFAGFCILVILAVTLSGCTSQNVATNTSVTTTAQKGIMSVEPNPFPATPSLTPTLASTSAKTETPTTVQTTQPIEKVSLTINSAQKQKTVYASTAPAGSMFLVLDITVKNNEMEKGYDLMDDTIILNYAKPGIPTVKSITTRVRGGLENPILMPTTIQLNYKRTGQVVFPVADTSSKYTISLIDDKGAIVSSAPLSL